MTIWDLVLTMKLLVVGAQPWLIVLMVQGMYSQQWILLLCRFLLLSWIIFPFHYPMFKSFWLSTYATGSFHAGQAKMENPLLLNGMRVKGL